MADNKMLFHAHLWGFQNLPNPNPSCPPEPSRTYTIQEPPAFTLEAIQAHRTLLNEADALKALDENRFEDAELALRRCIQASIEWPEKTLPSRQFRKTPVGWRLLLGRRLYKRDEYEEAIEILKSVPLSDMATGDERFEGNYLLAFNYWYVPGSDGKVEEHAVQALRLKEHLSADKMKWAFQSCVELLWDLYDKNDSKDKIAYLENFAFHEEQVKLRDLLCTVKDMKYGVSQDVVLTWLESHLEEDSEKLRDRPIEVNGNQSCVWGCDGISRRDAFTQTLDQSVEHAILGSSHGCCLLHILAASNKWALIRVLLDEEGTRLDSRLDYSGFTPLAIAIHYHSFQAAKVLLEKRPFLGVKFFGPEDLGFLELAAKTSHTRMQNLISNLTYWKVSSLASALQAGRILEAKELVEKGVNVNFTYPGNGLTPLLHVCRCYPHETELITSLLEAGANPNVAVYGKLNASKNTCINMTPLVYAIQADNLEVVRHLIEKQANLPEYIFQKPWKMGSANQSLLFVKANYGK